MSYLANLRAKIQGKAAPGKLLIGALAGVLVVGLAWWLVPLRSRPETGKPQAQPSSFQRVAQRRGTVPPTPKLQINYVRQTGQIVEIKGTAECDATVMINGERVPLIFDRCGFKHFVLLPEGPSTIAVTAQGPAGGVNTQLIKVNIE